MLTDSGIFYNKLRELCADYLDTRQFELLTRYCDLLFQANQAQNLTRIVKVEDFFHKNIIDVLMLQKSGFMSGLCADYGSGCGVPGILSALLDPSTQWVLIEAEKHKATFLQSAIDVLALYQVSIFYGRGEDYFRRNHANTITARAVGTVATIFSQIRKCSTWNNLILFKGPKWGSEWKDFQQSAHAGELSIKSTFAYSRYYIGDGRVLVWLTRV